MDFAITRISSKGQIVIPVEMRSDLKPGEKIMIIKNNDQFIMKKADALQGNFEEDLAFARRTEKAWEKYDKGEFKSMEYDDFLEEVQKW